MEKYLFQIFREITKTKLSDLEIINLALDAYFSNPVIAENPLRIKKIQKFNDKLKIFLENGEIFEIYFQRNSSLSMEK